jgi:hypothetical protein
MPALIHFAPVGTFYAWMGKKHKLGGQNKVPRLSNTREYLDDLTREFLKYPNNDPETLKT